MITTKQLAAELRINQRSIQNRILRLGIKPERIGRAFALTEKQAEKVRNYKKEMP